MARDISPVCKKCRREGEKLFLKGQKCLTEKCPLSKRGGKKSSFYSRRMSTYSLQLKEKQKVKLVYGILEAQFKKFFKQAAKKGNTAIELIILLERRLDNVVYRLQWATSRKQARQIVRHGHISVNGKKVDIPSFIVKSGDSIEFIDKESAYFKAIKDDIRKDNVVSWMQLEDNTKAQILRIPSEEDIKDFPYNTQMIVELYSK